jgi:pyroglutamyl-peptidase
VSGKSVSDARPTILITGFGRFPGAPFNPSGPLARALAKTRRPALSGVRMVAHVFPTSYAAVARQWPELIAQHRPDAVLMLGLAGRTKYLRIETRARNVRTLVYPDIEGFVPERRVIERGAASARRGHAPFMSLLAAARTSSLPARLSRDAGAYLCNDLYWRALDPASCDDGPLVQFVHIPLRPNALRAVEAVLVALVSAARRR